MNIEKLNKNININISTKSFNISSDKEYIDIEGYASKMYEADGSLKVDLDSENVNTRNFKLEAKRLFLNHNLEEAVGDLELTHKPDGIWIKARAYKDTMTDKEFNRLRRGLYDFSIGFMPTEAEYINVKGVDVLSFTSGVIYEVSLVNLASNSLATIEHMKSFSNDKGCVGLHCDLSEIKSMNPNMDCSCLDELKQESQREEMEKEIKALEFDKEKFAEAISKGLTIQETMNEPWNISDDFWKMMSYFIQTIEHNYDEFRWNDLPKEDMLTNLTLAFDVFKETVSSVSDRLLEAQNKSVSFDTIEGDKMAKENGSIIKTVDAENPENTQINNIETVEGKVADINESAETNVGTAPAVVEAGIVVENNLKTEENTSEVTNVGEANKADETTKNDDSAVEAEPLDVNKEVIAILSADLDKLEPEEIETMYETLADKLGDLYSAHEALNKIEQFVRQDLQNN